jgi:hypothetical protein
MYYYQVTITTYKWDWWKLKWVTKSIYPSTLIFKSHWDAEKYQYEYMDGLRKDGVKLKSGTFEIQISTLLFNDINSLKG